MSLLCYSFRPTTTSLSLGTKCHLLSPHQTPTTHSRAMGPARIWVPGCKTLRVGGFLEMFKELTPHLSFKNIKKTKGVMNGGKCLS